MGQPVRTCVGCRQRCPATELLRLVWDGSTGRVSLDEARRRPGRGAWLHRRADCWQAAVKRGGLARALRRRLQAEDLTEPRAVAEAWPVGR
ncbi:MAG: YlxR family protein [Propionibacteriaceae bacterium]|nr:YlxR family protein [Propionibacteriaceae bacterium]